ncbi:peptide/nickel transport system substrate-binding protein [Rhodoligotrophos appendicifer]|uniref:ABC transporter substrate-binding protein n=1 Tax=Rhodoligotrophos appendicifer TaxID=987056 RepID=UPI00117F7758|nr:ABC transporter substrate-binding protein [Rhodoligotrophos appendicifer]
MTDEMMLKRVLQRGISRRQFMYAAAGLGVSLGAADLLWTAEARAQGKPGGILKIGLAGGATTDSLNPATYTDTFMVMIGYTVRGNLTEVAPDGSAAGEIAESFEGSDGAKKWVFKIRNGVTFSNGKSLTLDDVIASINYHRGESSTSGAKPLLTAISDIKADGKDTVIFTLLEGNADFPFVLADYHLNIMPFSGDTPALDIGAGPYTLKSFEPGVKAVLERNPSSYKKAYVDGAEMIAISDATARQNALVTGQVDMINRTDLKTAHLLARNKTIRIEDVPGRMYYNMPANVTVDPFKSNDVRLALKFGIDRQAIVDKILYGHGQAGNDQPITPSYRYHAKDLAPRAFDPDKSKFHLKKAGLESIDIQLSAADAAFPGAVDAAVLYSEDAKKGGINIKVVRESNDGYWDNVWLKKDFCTAYWGGRPTEDVMLTIAFAKGAAWNESDWDNARFNELLVAARGELDESKRRSMYEEMQHIISDDGGVVVPVFANHVEGVSNKVGHEKEVSGVWELDGARCIERWWLT